VKQESINKYLNEDFAKALKFYDEGANSSKKVYRFLSIYVIVISALLTPLVAFIPDDIYWRIISTIMAATIVIASGLLAHLKSHENWLSYRSSWDALERERRLFETHSGKYSLSTNPDELFVEQIETILSKEAIDFYARHAKVEEKKEVSIQNNVTK